MENKSKKGRTVSRRGILPLLGSTLLIPFLGFSKSFPNANALSQENDDEYQTLLRPDGTTVKVKKSVIKNSKIVKQKVSNKSLLNWLGRKE
jgi:hypothetical protein